MNPSREMPDHDISVEERMREIAEDRRKR
jgi:hypothetical protein